MSVGNAQSIPFRLVELRLLASTLFVPEEKGESPLARPWDWGGELLTGEWGTGDFKRIERPRIGDSEAANRLSGPKR